MIRTICPSKQEITDYLQGRLSDSDSESIERHLVDCEACEQTAAGLEASGDSLMRHLRLKPDAVQEDVDWQFCRSLLSQLPSRVDQSAPPSDAISLQKALRPQSVYHYRLGQQLGHGGMGVVYRSDHPQLHRPVAVKILSASRAADAPSIARFQREMRAAGALDHDGIVRAVDAGVWQGTYYLVMEYVDGIDLSRLVRLCGPLRQSDAAAIVVQAAEALHYAHQHQVIHRDIKPSNLMLTRDGAVKILDFGLARLEHGGLTSHDATTAGRLVGTLDYLSPEQAAGQQPIDGRADIYGLGATLFKLIAGRPPHGNSQDRPILQHLQRLTTTDADSLSEIRQDVDPPFCQAVAKLLCRDPGQRPASAQHVVQLMRPFCQGSDLSHVAQESMIKLELEGETAAPDQPPLPVPTDSVQMTGEESSEKASTAEARAISPQSVASHQVSATRSSRWLPPWITAIGLMLLGSFGGVAGVTLWLQTGWANLKIESEVEDISLQLIKDGEIAREIVVRQNDDFTSVRAGKYELRIAGKTDHVRLDQTSLLLMRGDTRVVRITQEAKPPNSPQAQADSGSPTRVDSEWARQLAALEAKLNHLQSTFGPNHPDVIQAQQELAAMSRALEKRAGQTDEMPTSRGRTYAEWTKIVLRETDAETVADGVKALVELSTEAEHSATLMTLLAIAKNNESRLGTPVCDAYIHYLTPGDEHGIWQQIYPPADEGWLKILAALDEAIEDIRDAISDRVFNELLTTGAEASRRILLVSALDSDINRTQKVQLCQLLRDPMQPSEVRAIAHHVYLEKLDSPPDNETQRALQSDNELLLKAVVATLLERQEYRFSDEQGAACGKLITSGQYGFFNYVSDLVDQAAAEGESFRGRNECLFLESVGSSILDQWKQTSEESKLIGHELMAKLSTVNLMMSTTRRAAIQKLRFYLQRLLIKRDSLTQPMQSPESVGKLNIYGVSRSLILMEGKIPVELETHRMQDDAAIGKEFKKWEKDLGDNPHQALESGELFAYLYPLESAEVIFQLLAKADDAPPKRTPSGQTVKRKHPLLRVFQPWLAIPIASRSIDDERTRKVLDRVLSELRSDPPSPFAFRVPKGYGKELFRFAQDDSMQHRALALHLAQLSGFDETKTQALAQKMVTADLKLEMDNGDFAYDMAEPYTLRWCLKILAGAEDLKLAKSQADIINRQVLALGSRRSLANTEVLGDCFLNAMTINRRLKIDAENDQGVLNAALGITRRSKTFNWPRPQVNRAVNHEQLIWIRIAGAVPIDITKFALQTLLEMPVPDPDVLERLKEMRDRSVPFPRGPEHEGISLLDRAIAAVENEIDQSG